MEHIATEAARRRIILNVYHACLRVILSPLRNVGIPGINIVNGYGHMHRGHLIYAANVADYMENIATCCCKMGECPQCTVPCDQLGELQAYATRNMDKILAALEVYETNPAEFFKACNEAGIKPVIHPFWEKLPFCNISLCITPDILHQLLQGLLKYLVLWIKAVYGYEEIDKRCRAMPRNHHIRHFFHGLSPLQRIPGKEHRQIAQILLGLIINLPSPNVKSPQRLINATHALLDFIYISQYSVQSISTIALLQDALQCFHDNKAIFIDLGSRQDFNLPKLHFVSH